MKTRSIFILMLCLLMALFAAACGSESSNGGSAGESGGSETQEQATAKFYHDMPALTDYLQETNEILQKSDNVKLEIVPYSEPTSYQTTVRVGFTSGEGPDIFKWWNGFRMKELVDAGYLADMTAEWEQMVADGVEPAMAAPLTFDGKTYGIPGGVHYWVMYYNKKIFDQYGLKEPTTWEEFLEVCRTLKSNGVTPMGQTVTDFWPGFIWFEDLLKGYDPDFYNKLVVGEAKYTDPQAVEVMEIWKSLYDEGYFAAPEDFNNEIAPSLAKGEFAMYLKGTWYAQYLEAAGMKAGEDYSAFILPSIKPENGHVVMTEIAAFLVSESSENKENAKKALTALTKKEAHEKLLSLYGGFPIRKDVEPSDPVAKKIADDVKNNEFTMLTRFWEATPSEMSEYASNEFVRFMLKPDTYLDILKNIQDKADKYWASQQ